MKKLTTNEYVGVKPGAKNVATLTFRHRKIIEKMLSEGAKIKDIALAVQHSRSTIFYERLRMGSKDTPYKATVAQEDCDSKKIKKTYDVPLSHVQMLRNVYKCLRDISTSNSLSDIRSICKNGMGQINQTGLVNPKAFVRSVSIEEESKIIKKYKEGVSIMEISIEFDRHRATIYRILDKYKQTLTNDIGEYTNEQLESRWID